MVVFAIEDFVLLSTIFAIVFFATAAGIRLVSKHQLCALKIETLIRIYTWAIILPPVLAAWIVGAAFLPQWWAPEVFHAAHTSQHDLHLVGNITANIEPTLAYLMLLFAVGAALFAAWSGWQSYLRVGRLIARLQTNAAPVEPEQLAMVDAAARRYGLEAGLVMSNYPFSFLWGFGRSKLIVSTGLLRTLTAEELSGLLEHEAAHHQRRDNLIKLALSFCTYTSVAFPLARRILRWRSVEVEGVCDEIAVSRTNAPLEIASALVKLRRQTAPSLPATSSFMAEDVSSFQKRVSRLIEAADRETSLGSRVARWPRFLISALIAVFVASLVYTYFSPLGFHHAVESLIQLFT